jgi:nucleotide-binding universal stress UspA family protein
MKNILVLMHDDAGQEARFQAAVDIVRALDGHLTCLDVAIAPVCVDEYVDTGGAALLMIDEQQREESNRSRMEARLKAEDVPYDWIDESGILAPCVRDAMTLADLVVVNRELDSLHYPDMQALVAQLLKSNKPILAVPERARQLDIFGNALAAWDGSREAEAALRAATPLLEKAATVTIVEVNDGSVNISAAEAASYLSRHGIKAIIRLESGGFDTASTVLLDVIERTRADYLVMGGFGHRRFIEAAFGGVTRRMLEESPVPLLLAR